MNQLYNLPSDLFIHFGQPLPFNDYLDFEETRHV